MDGSSTPAPGSVELAAIVATLRAAGCVWAEDEAAALLADAHSPAELSALVARRVAGEPLEQVLGWAQFGGLRVGVAPAVFVPRQRSEHLVDVAIGLLARRREAASVQIAPPLDRSGPDRSATHRRVAPERRSSSAGGAGDAPPVALVILDLCAGSGALGLALHHRAGPFTLIAADLDPVAVACAAVNLESVGGVTFAGDLFEPIPPALRGRIDLILANAPYVPTAELALLPHEAREHEPPLALDGGPDGLAVHRRILAAAPPWLLPGGSVVIELAEHQVAAALGLLAGAGLYGSTHPAPQDPSTVVVVGTRRAPRP